MGCIRGVQSGVNISPSESDPVTHTTVDPDPGTSRLPPRSISTSEFGVTRKNRHVPCLDRSHSSAVMATSPAISRSPVVSFLK